MNHTVDDFLRAEGRFGVSGHYLPAARLLAMLCGAGALYGAVLGSWSRSIEQVLYAAVKVPLLLVVATLVCLPNFYVVNCLLGLRSDFMAALRGILSAQVALAITLSALVPVVIVLYLSGPRYELIKILNGVLFVIASLGAQLMLRRHYRALIRRDRRHRIALICWPILYVFVAMQLAYTLRPFIGAPFLRAQFLREEAWKNVYLELYYMIQGVTGWS